MSSPVACLVAMRHRLMWWEPFFFCSDSGPSSSSFCRLYFVLRFWNHTFTWAREGRAQMRNTQEAPRAATRASALTLSWEPNGETEARVLSSGQLSPDGSGGLLVWERTQWAREGQFSCPSQQRRVKGQGAAEHPEHPVAIVQQSRKVQALQPGGPGSLRVSREEIIITPPQG